MCHVSHTPTRRIGLYLKLAFIAFSITLTYFSAVATTRSLWCARTCFFWKTLFHLLTIFFRLYFSTSINQNKSKGNRDGSAQRRFRLFFDFWKSAVDSRTLRTLLTARCGRRRDRAVERRRLLMGRYYCGVKQGPAGRVCLSVGKNSNISAAVRGRRKKRKKERKRRQSRNYLLINRSRVTWKNVVTEEQKKKKN